MYKRSQAVCGSILELYSRQMLNVSFEIAYDTLLIADGVEYIDASPNNVITGMAIVSRPAYPEAVATRLVAEEAGQKDEHGDQPAAEEKVDPTAEDMPSDDEKDESPVEEEGVKPPPEQAEVTDEEPAPATNDAPQITEADDAPLGVSDAAEVIEADDAPVVDMDATIPAAVAAQEDNDDSTEGVNDMTLEEATNRIAELEGEVQDLMRQ